MTGHDAVNPTGRGTALGNFSRNAPEIAGMQLIAAEAYRGIGAEQIGLFHGPERFRVDMPLLLPLPARAHPGRMQRSGPDQSGLRPTPVDHQWLYSSCRIRDFYGYRHISASCRYACNRTAIMFRSHSPQTAPGQTHYRHGTRRKKADWQNVRTCTRNKHRPQALSHMDTFVGNPVHS